VYAVSAAFQSAMAAGGTRLVRIEQLDGAMNVKATYDGMVNGGRVDLTQTKEIRRTVAMTVANPGGLLTPAMTSDPFFFNQRFRVWIGVVKADGTSEYAPVGTFLVNVCESDLQTDTLAVVAVDFWKYLQLAALKTLKSYAVGATLTSIFNDLLDTAQTLLGGITIPRLIDPIAGAAVLGGTDPLQFAAGARVADCLSPFMESYGWDFGFDPLGVFNGRLYVKPETIAPSFTLRDTDQGVSRLNPRMEDSPDVRNHVRVVGTSPDVAPMFAEAQDNNVNSPTYIGGIFGDRLDVFESPDVLDATQAQNVANARLRRLIALATPVSYEGTARPELDVWDVGLLTSVKGKLAGAPYWVESLSIPLTTDAMTIRFAAVRPLS
jgi:hypothetical protein